MLGDPLPAGALARIGSERLRHADVVTALAVSPGGKWLASHSRWESFVSIWATDTGKLRSRLPATGVVKMAFAHDGNTLAVIVATSAFTGEILVDCWDIATATRVSRHRDVERYAEEALLAFAPDGQDLVLGRSSLRRLARGDGKLAWEVMAGQGADDRAVFAALAIAPDGEILASAAGAHVGLRDARTGQQRYQAAAGSAVSRLAFAADGRQLAVGTNTGAIEIWRLPPALENQRLPAIEKRLLPPWASGAITELAFSADGRNLLYVGARGEAGLIDVAAGKYSVRRRLPASRYGAAAFDVARRPLAFTVHDRFGIVTVWDVAAGRQRFTGRDFGGAVTCLAFSPDSQTLVTGGDDKKLRFWQARTGKPLGLVDLPGSPCQADFSEDGKELIAGGGGQWWQICVNHRTASAAVGAAAASGLAFAQLRGAPPPDTIWGQAKPDWVRALPSKRELIEEGTLSPDGFLLEAARDRVQVIEVRAKKKLYELQGIKYLGAALTPNRRALAVLQNETTVTLSALDGAAEGDRRVSAELEKNEKNAPTTTLPNVGGAAEVDRWDLERTELIRGQPWLVPCLAFGPGGRLLAIGTPRGSILFWDLATSRQIHKLPGHDVPVASLAFAPDGRSLACAYRDATVLVWDVSSVAPKDEAGSLPPLEESWLGLDSAEPPAAWKAHWALVQGGPQAVGFLKERVQPARAVRARPIGPLIKDLDHAQFVIRQRATRELERLGRLAEADMRKALEKSVNLEVRQRLQQLLAKLEGVQRRQVQEIRAVAVLEQIASAEAARLLEALAGGDPESPLTVAARTARSRQRQQISSAKQ
jgi:WD40 repeat protein